tara:strand:+ start:406 stop:1173 length:768 start_codon:yes stop_codon:yes gene_type:complete
MLKDPFDFKGTHVLVAGGATGLGYELTRAFCNKGATSIIFSRNERNVQNAVKEINGTRNNSCYGYVCDITDEDQLKKLISDLEEKYGKIDIAVNSVGINVRNKIEKVSIKEWENIIRTNLTGAFIFAKAVFPLLSKSEFGRLINITSIFSTISFPERVSYASSKGGMIQLTKTLALEWADKGITVNSISPGPFLTDLNKPLLNNPEAYESFCKNIPLKRFGNTSEIITAGLFLASHLSSYVTGADICVDGGWTTG